MLKEFKEFAARGNVLDMAVGIISPFCVSAIPAKAIRCPHCTADLRAEV